MNSNRIQLLEQSIKDSPDDPFYPYALALEFKENNPEKSLELLKKTHDRFPDYLPLYYQLAELLSEKGDRENALQIYDEGIHLAGSSKDIKILSELRNAKQNLLFEEDD